MAFIELICPECEMRTTLNEMYLMPMLLCSVCLKKKKHNMLICADRYDAEQRQKELSKRLYCHNCGHIGLIEQFPFDAPSEDSMRERRCPRCHGENIVNMGIVQMCEHCDEVPAAKKEIWCRVCIDAYNEAFIER